MDTVIHGLYKGDVSHTDWFGAAQHVTNWDGIGAVDNINLGFLTDDEESYLRFVHHSLAPRNNQTFDNLRAGAFAGLSGQRLDDALVVKEQLLVAAFTNQYFTGKPNLRGRVMSGLNSSFDHNSLVNRMIMPGKTLQALDNQFGKKSFDLGNLNHRIKLGMGLTNIIRDERGH